MVSEVLKQKGIIPNELHPAAELVAFDPFLRLCEIAEQGRVVGKDINVGFEKRLDEEGKIDNIWVNVYKGQQKTIYAWSFEVSIYDGVIDIYIRKKGKDFTLPEKTLPIEAFIAGDVTDEQVQIIRAEDVWKIVNFLEDLQDPQESQTLVY